jgi:CheY-like chemotaxis protein
VPPKLLLADDSVTIQRVIELTFADEDVQVLAVGDGQQAIDCLQVERPDIVLADVGMPQRDGYEVAAFIKADPQLAHIPVLLLTGAFEPVDEVKARAVGCDGVLVKPFEPQMVISRVRDLLAGKRASEPSFARPEFAGQPVPRPVKSERVEAPAPPVTFEAAGGSLEDYFDRLDAALASKSAPMPPAYVPAPAPPAPTPAPPAPASYTPPAAPPMAKPAPVPVSAPAPAPSVAAASVPGPTAVTPPPAPPLPESDTHLDLGNWDPSAPVEAVSPAPAIPVRKEVLPPPAAVPPPAAPAAAEAWNPDMLQDAFAALLAAEQAHAIAPQPAAAPQPPPRAEAPSPELIDEIASRVIARMGDESMRSAVLDAAERLVREEIARIKSQS